MSPTSIGVNLRVTGQCSQGGRKYMEDFFSVAYQQSEDEKDLEYAFFGIFDGHGGAEAAKFAKEHLLGEIVNQKSFWSDCDDDVLRAIREGYIQTHYAMWRKQDKWPKTATGLPSTAGTTASVAFIRKGKIYIGHVGDSGIVLGYQENGEKCWRARQLTQDHKPECNIEKARIINSGGKVVTKSGVPRVVWNRPRIGHKGPVRRSTPFDEIPFLAVARSLGDLWSYNSELNQFVVSPDPDVRVIKIDPKTFRCLIFGTDGLWNVISSCDSIDIAREAEITNERLTYMCGNNASSNEWRNPSKCLVDKALERWTIRKMRADNTSVVTVMLDPPDLPKKDISRPTTSYGLEYIQMEGEINSQDDYHRTIQDVNHLQNSNEYFYNANSQTNVLTTSNHNNYQNELHSVQNSYTTTCYQNVNQRYDNVCDNYSYYDNNSVMDNSSSNYIFDNCSSSSLVSTSSVNQPQQQHQQSDIYSNGLSFAESYNSLLLSSLENENSSSSSRSCSDSDEDSEPDAQHIYQSLNETGLAGHDHVYHHFPNIINQQQQQQYQESCMLDEEGYSLTKLETRCEQRLRNYSNINNRNVVRHDHRITFQNNLNNNHPNSSLTNFNQYDSITSSYNSPSSLSYQKNSVIDDCKNNETVKDQLQFSKTNDKLDDHIKENSKNDVIKENVDESIQINEISSSFNETSSPSASSTCKSSNVILDKKYKNYKDDDIDMLELNKSKVNIKLIHKLNKSPKPSSTSEAPRTRSTRATRLLYSLKQNNENISIQQDTRQQIRYTKRTLRSRNSLSKDLKAKSTTRKSHYTTRSIVTNEYLKSAASASQTATVKSDVSLLCKLRSRQINSTQSQQKPKQITIWPITRSRSTISTSSALCGNNNINKKNNSNNPRLRNSLSINLRNSINNPVTSTNSNYKNNRLHNKIVQSSTTSSTTTVSSSSSKRSLSSRNSAWYPAKHSVQTRNRVQKR